MFKKTGPYGSMLAARGARETGEPMMATTDAHAFLIALDQGTTSTRAILFDGAGNPVATAQDALPQIYPRAGWVEHDPEAIWQSVRKVLAELCAIADGQGIDRKAIAALGLTNQRETTVLWDRDTGRPVANAIVWQDRRTAEACASLRAAGHEPDLAARTGLLFDPYFSATKLAWLLDNIPDARPRAEAGRLAFGTIDSFLIWRLTDGRVHATDATNAARTLLFNIHSGAWDDDLLDLFRIPRAVLPEICDCVADFGRLDPSIIGLALSIAGVAGDQQAAVVGQACFMPGEAKATFGTGCFLLANTGRVPVASTHRLLTTPAYRLGGETTFALEGSVFMAGAVVQWLRDGLRLFDDASATEDLAAAANPRLPVFLVPAFTGLGAPYWDPDARGAIVGLTRDVGVAELVRAGLEAVSFQLRDLIEAMEADMRAAGHGAQLTLRVDGGMVANSWFLQNLADLTGHAVEPAAMMETTALGAAFLAGLGAGVYDNLEDLRATRRSKMPILPRMSADERETRYQGWRHAVARVRTTSCP